jgi:hypothetical protein
MSNKHIKTFIVKGTVVTNPYLDNINRAQFVRIVATSNTTTIQINSVDSTILGELYLHIAGHEITVEKAPDDSLTISTGGAKVHAIGSPRS